MDNNFKKIATIEIFADTTVSDYEQCVQVMVEDMSYHCYVLGGTIKVKEIGVK